MPGSSVELSTKIINHLKYTYGIDDSNAHTIYNEATNLYHELLAMIDLSPLRTTDNKILSSLIIIICEYYDFGEISGNENGLILSDESEDDQEDDDGPKDDDPKDDDNDQKEDNDDD
ncbi:unnamed protein product [Rotaria sordida]|uniref:Uncharacterized protein n=1 Tax=Rotaria sordida TaxID=392033 RepID=A0A815PDL5_9BILA|nr:unnamed protein product [Rotaria sordida]